ncbi:unnamed protein product [Sphagnum tenellum]
MHARAQDPTTAFRNDRQVLSKYQGRTELKLQKSRTSAPPAPTDPSQNRSGSQSSDLGQRSTAAEARRTGVRPTPPLIAKPSKGRNLGGS